MFSTSGSRAGAESASSCSLLSLLIIKAHGLVTKKPAFSLCLLERVIKKQFPASQAETTKIFQCRKGKTLKTIFARPKLMSLDQKIHQQCRHLPLTKKNSHFVPEVTVKVKVIKLPCVTNDQGLLTALCHSRVLDQGPNTALLHSRGQDPRS
jgi:hypothetical protein